VTPPRVKRPGRRLAPAACRRTSCFSPTSVHLDAPRVRVPVSAVPEVLCSFTGRVKWFNESKGYGFIEREGTPTFSSTISAIEGEGFKTLKEGQVVEFEFKEGPKGAQAVLVRKPVTV